jgi:hypothetical protein
MNTDCFATNCTNEHEFLFFLFVTDIFALGNIVVSLTCTVVNSIQQKNKQYASIKSSQIREPLPWPLPFGEAGVGPYIQLAGLGTPAILVAVFNGAVGNSA